ncbi:MAG: neutral/alkaline non-lysosomal ceramidase N-terminal domain-containing protein [Verrucomicrobiia bacterium]
MKHCLPILLLCCCTAFAADFQAGVAKVKITPPTPFWMSGYSSRTNQSMGVFQDLWARALALRDPQGHRVVIVTCDLIGLHHCVSDDVFARAKKQFKLNRSDVLLCCSHAHSGPVVGLNLNVMFDFSAEDKQRVLEYSARLTDNLVNVIGDALKDLAPARLATGHGSAAFAINRRQRAGDKVALGVNPTGPVDHDVPVLKVTSPDGKLRTILFGYACHNTTIGGKGDRLPDFYKIHGDYAGQAEAELEKLHPGATAMFTILCGADQNPNPRGSLDLAVEHGKALAAEVERVLGADLRPVHPPIRTAFQSIQLDFAAHTRQTFEEELKKAGDPKKPNKFLRRRAEMMLAAYDQNHPIRQTPYPVQAIRLGNDLTMIALGGEVVVDYQLRCKREFPNANLMTIGYANDVMCYIPSLRILKEGGYEADFSMIYYGQPGPFAENVEETVIKAIHQVLAKVGEGK